MSFHDELNEIRRRAGLQEQIKLVRVWHVTEKRNVPSILKNGLEPKIGPRSRSVGERKPAIYVFPDWTSLEDGLTNWLSDETEYRQSVLELRVPEEWLKQDPVMYEAIIDRPVPSNMIRVLIPDIDEWAGEYPNKN